ncbi:MAG TPA: GNAT family N-acetyltransferase [Fimbriimonas sp.]|nr:GNAT family N-acetyltransferase [Fimbriimonas sp.]
MTLDDVEPAAALQSLSFPPPFPADLLWQPSHLQRHLELFPEGQFVAEADGEIVASCSNTIISEALWQSHESWSATVGGPLLDKFDRQGTTLYGLDITVHPDFRRMGIGREFYSERFALVERLGLSRYGTACRLPDFRRYRTENANSTPEIYARAVANGGATDRTLTPLLRYGLSLLGVIENYMEDEESCNAAALLEKAR